MFKKLIKSVFVSLVLTAIIGAVYSGALALHTSHGDAAAAGFVLFCAITAGAFFCVSE